MTTRPAGFDELGLRRALADRVLPFLVAAMALLAALALAGWVGAASLARHWQEGAGAALTVQVPQPGEPAAQGGGTRLERVLALLARQPRHRRGPRAERRRSWTRCCIPGSAPRPSTLPCRCPRLSPSG